MNLRKSESKRKLIDLKILYNTNTKSSEMMHTALVDNLETVSMLHLESIHVYASTILLTQCSLD